MTKEKPKIRRNPFIHLTSNDLDFLISQAFPGEQVANFIPMKEGYSNSNFKINLSSGQSYTLRIHTNGQEKYLTQINVLNQLKASLAVPDMIFSSDQFIFQNYPVSIHSYIEGSTLTNALLLMTSNPDKLYLTGLSAGTTLKKIHSLKIDTISFGADDYFAFVDDCLDKMVRQNKAETSQCQRIRSFIKEHHELIEQCYQAYGLVHGDFNPENIVTDPDICQISGILDWEWCHRGSVYADPGNLLRPHNHLPESFVAGFLDSYLEDHFDCKELFFKKIRLIDLSSHLEKLTSYDEKSEQYLDSVQRIKSIIEA